MFCEHLFFTMELEYVNNEKILLITDGTARVIMKLRHLLTKVLLLIPGVASYWNMVLNIKQLEPNANGG